MSYTVSSQLGSQIYHDVILLAVSCAVSSLISFTVGSHLGSQIYYEVILLAVS